MQGLVEAKIARPLPDPEVGLVLYRAINLAHIVFGPLIEQMLSLSMSDPVVLERFREAAVDLLTHPVFNEAPGRPRQLGRPSARSPRSAARPRGSGRRG